MSVPGGTLVERVSLTDAEKGDHRRLLQQQTTLARFGELALKSDDLDEILTEACRLVGGALGTDLAKVVELQEDGETLLVRAGVGWKPGVVGQVTLMATDDTSEGHAIKTGEPMVSSDIARETRFRYPAFLIEHGVKAVANVLILGDQGRPPFGILQIDSREPRRFTEDDTTFLRTYANLIAAAVSRLRMITGMRDTEARLRASEERFRTLVTATSFVVYRMSPDWTELRQLDGRGVPARHDGSKQNLAERICPPGRLVPCDGGDPGGRADEEYARPGASGPPRGRDLGLGAVAGGPASGRQWRDHGVVRSGE